jgi:hypothetical protein
MKTITLSFLLLLTTQLFAQTSTDRYIVLKADVSERSSGETTLTSPDYPKGDTLLDNKMLDGLYGKTPAEGLNILAKDGWVLVNSVFIPHKRESLFSAWIGLGYMQFYMRKTFIAKDTFLKQ